MTLPLISFLVAAIIPVFFGTIRSAPFWLTAQAIALAWNVAQHGDPSLHTYVALIEVLVVRALVAPRLLSRAIRRRDEPNRDLMPSNLFSWAIAIALVVMLAIAWGHFPLVPAMLVLAPASILLHRLVR